METKLRAKQGKNIRKEYDKTLRRIIGVTDEPGQIVDIDGQHAFYVPDVFEIAQGILEAPVPKTRDEMNLIFAYLTQVGVMDERVDFEIFEQALALWNPDWVKAFLEFCPEKFILQMAEQQAVMDGVFSEALSVFGLDYCKKAFDVCVKYSSKTSDQVSLGLLRIVCDLVELEPDIDQYARQKSIALEEQLDRHEGKLETGRYRHLVKLLLEEKAKSAGFGPISEARVPKPKM